MPFPFVMRRIIFSLLLICSFATQANILDDVAVEPAEITSQDISRIYDEQTTISIIGLEDVLDRQAKVDRCMEEYVKKQSKSYAKIVQNNLYDMIHNFDKIASKIYGKKPIEDDVSYDEKLEALAKVQCEAYYTMGVLK